MDVSNGAWLGRLINVLVVTLLAPTKDVASSQGLGANST